MGVPVSFMDKYNPKQFELVGCPDYREGPAGASELGIREIGDVWMSRYRAQGGRGHYSANMVSLVYYDGEGRACNTFKRILVRRKM